MLIKVQHGEIVWTNIQYILMDFFKYDNNSNNNE